MAMAGGKGLRVGMVLVRGVSDYNMRNAIEPTLNREPTERYQRQSPRETSLLTYSLAPQRPLAPRYGVLYGVN